MMLSVNQCTTCQEQQLLPMCELWPGAMLGRVCSQSHGQGRWKRGNHPILHPCPSLKIYLRHDHWFLPQFPRTGFSIHTRERKFIFPASFLPAHVCKALWEENYQTPQVISVITLDPYVPWACCHPWDQQPSLPFAGRDYLAYQKTKLLTLFLKSLNSLQSQFLIYSWMNSKDRITFARSKNVTGNTTAKPQALLLS